jgi:site-specific recombinase XerD
MDIRTAIQHCLDELSLAERTKLAYRNGLNHFTEYLHQQNIELDQDISLITVDHFVYFYAYLSSHFSKATAAVYGSAAISLLNSLVIAGKLSPSYSDTIRIKMAVDRSRARHEEKLPRFPGKDDVMKMLKAVRGFDVAPRMERNTALLEFLASTGCRISEATALNVKDIDFTERSTIVMGKGSKERRVWFSQTAADCLKAYWKARGAQAPNDPIFARHDRGAGVKKVKRLTPTSARNIVKDVANLAGIDPAKFSPHYFRHAFGIKVLSETGNLALVQDLMGHQNPTSTRVYAKIATDDMKSAHREIFK